MSGKIVVFAKRIKLKNLKLLRNNNFSENLAKIYRHSFVNFVPLNLRIFAGFVCEFLPF